MTAPRLVVRLGASRAETTVEIEGGGELPLVEDVYVEPASHSRPGKWRAVVVFREVVVVEDDA